MNPDRAYYTSPLSEFCAEHLPGDFHYLDGDEVLLRYSSQPIQFARASRNLRICEAKRKGEQIRRSQREVLPLLAEGIAALISKGDLASGSGVFLIEGEMPYEDGASIYQVLPTSNSRAVGLQLLGPREMDKAQLHLFMRCRGDLEVAA